MALSSVNLPWHIIHSFTFVFKDFSYSYNLKYESITHICSPRRQRSITTKKGLPPLFSPFPSFLSMLHVLTGSPSSFDPLVFFLPLFAFLAGGGVFGMQEYWMLCVNISIFLLTPYPFSSHNISISYICSK